MEFICKSCGQRAWSDDEKDEYCRLCHRAFVRKRWHEMAAGQVKARKREGIDFGVFKCKVCGQKFERQYINGSREMCPACAKKKHLEDYWQKRLEGSLLAPAYGLVCRKCGATFDRPTGQGSREYCQRCSKRESARKYWQTLRDIVRENREKAGLEYGQFTCQDCGKTFTRRMIKGSRKYCNECSQRHEEEK